MKNLMTAKRVKMVGNSLILLLLSITLVTCASTHHTTDNSKKVDKKIIKTKTRISYDFNEENGEYFRVFFMKQITSYDKTGSMAETLYYGSSKKLILKTTHNENNQTELFYYDDNGNILKKQICSSNDNDDFKCSTYDINGKIIEKDSSPFNEEDCSQGRRFEIDKRDKKGDIAESTTYTDNKSSKTRYEHQYDSDGNRTMVTTYRVEGKKEFLKHQLIFKYEYYP